MSRYTVQRLLQEAQQLLELTLLAGRKGLWRPIESFTVQRPGLALTGFVEHFRKDRIQLLGFNEIAYLNSLGGAELTSTVEVFLGQQPPCVVIARDLEVPAPLLELADRERVPVFSTPLLNSVFVDRAAEFLDEKLSSTTSVHGVLVDVLGVGILLKGRSGLGKSEVS